MKNILFLYIIPFLKKYKIFIAPVLLLLFFFFVVIFSFFLTPKRTTNNNSLSTVTPQAVNQETISAQPGETSLSPSTTPVPSSFLEPEELEHVWEPVAFSPDSLDGIQSTSKSLPDGSTAYMIPSDNATRPDMVQVKNGIMILQRQSISGETINDYENYLKEPDYIAQGSKYYGPDAVYYIYLNQGIAFIANQQTNEVYEQLTFQPVAANEFKQTYGDDIIGSLQKPSVTPEP
jgi:hypothetical protein